jgi:hypothetical protein
MASNPRSGTGPFTMRKGLTFAHFEGAQQNNALQRSSRKELKKKEIGGSRKDIVERKELTFARFQERLARRV